MCLVSYWGGRSGKQVWVRWQGKGKAKAREWTQWSGVEGRGDETPTELLLYVNIYFRQSYLAGDGTMGDWRPN